MSEGRPRDRERRGVGRGCSWGDDASSSPNLLLDRDLLEHRLEHEGHRYEVNVNYVKHLAEHGLAVSGWSPDGQLPEIMEIPDHPWFIGVQFHPELKSRPFDPHPLFRSFIAAAVKQGRLV